MANLLSSFLNGSSTFTYNNGTNVIPSYTLVQPTFSNTSTGASIFNQTFGSSSSFGNSLLFGSSFGGSSFGGSTLTSGFGNSFNVGGFNTSFNYGSLGNGFGFGTVARTPTTPTPTVNLLTSVDTDQDTDFPFVASDFEFPDGTAIGSIQIVDVPANGTLELNGSEVDEGDIIAAADLDELDYVPDQYFDQTDSFVVNLSTDGTTYDTTNYTIEIDVEGENDAPDVAAISTVGITEGETASDIGSLIVASVSDVDTDDSLGTVTITDLPDTANGSLKYTSDAGGTVTITADDTTISASEAATLVFESNSDIVDGSTDPDTTIDLEIKFTVTDEDGLAGSSGGTVNIQISDGNDAPTITADFSAPILVNENETVVGSMPYPATDEETNETISYSITGIDAEHFNIDSIDGTITFRNAPDFENPSDINNNNVYLFNIIAADDEGLTASTSVTVQVGNQSGDIALTVPSSTSIDEGTSFAFTALASTVDESNEYTFSIGDGGVDGDLFEIDEDSGELSFKNSPDAEDPEDDDLDNVYSVEVIVTDSEGVTDEDTISLTVTDLHDEDPKFLVATSSATSVASTDDSTSNISFSNTDEGTLELKIDEISSASTSATIGIVAFWSGEFSSFSATEGGDFRSVVDAGNIISNLADGATGEFTFDLTSDASTDNFTIAPTTSNSGFDLYLESGASLDYESDPTIVLSVTITDEGGDTAQTDITISVQDINEPAEYTAPVDQQTDSDQPELIGDEIVGSMVDPENDDLYFVVQSPEDSQVAIATSTFANYDYGDLYYEKNGFSGADQVILDGAFVAIDSVEANTLEYFAWDTAQALESESDSDAFGVPEVTINYWAFDDEDAAIAFAVAKNANSSSTSDTAIAGSIDLVIIDMEL